MKKFHFEDQYKLIKPKEEWTESERWIWEKSCNGEIADFNKKYQTDINPEYSEGWNEERLITPNFLEAILTDPYKSLLHRRGVRIVGGWVVEPIDLTNGKIDVEWWMENCRFENIVDLSLLNSSNRISFDWSIFKNDLILNSAKIEKDLHLSGIKNFSILKMISASISGNVYITDGAELTTIEMCDAKIGGNLDLSGIKVTNKIDMDSLSVSDDLIVGKGSEFKNITMPGAKIGGYLVFIGVIVTEELDMISIFVNKSISFKESGKYNKIELGKANIKGDLFLYGVISENLDLSFISIGGDIHISQYINRNTQINSEFNELQIISAKIGGSLVITANIIKDLNISFSTVYGNLNLFGSLGIVQINYANINENLRFTPSKVERLELKSSNIRGELQIGLDSINLVKNSSFNLSNTKVGTLQDFGEESWPDNLDLNGFTCSQLGIRDYKIGLKDKNIADREDKINAEKEPKNIADRDVKWLISWLEKDKLYSPQPYQHLSSIFAALGHSGKSNAILYSSKNRERKVAFREKHWGQWLGLSLLNLTIGYGIGVKYFRSLIWVFGFTIIGVLVLNSIESIRSESIWYKVFYSLDMLLPIIQLNDNYKLNFVNWQLYYFYFHYFSGFLLGSFIIAGLSGITKK